MLSAIIERKVLPVGYKIRLTAADSIHIEGDSHT
jgi:hypothetical protein